MKWYLYALKNSFNFAGRARRAEYGWFTLINFLISLSFNLIILFLAMADGAMDFETAATSSLSGLGTGAVIVQVISWIYSIVVFFAGISITTRRLHDLGWSGWWQLAFVLVPVALLLVMVVLAGLFGERNQILFGVFTLLFIVVGIIMLVIWLILIFKDGDRFTNKYGADPKAISAETTDATQTFIH